MPRAYRLGERAALKEATRERIVEAAIELYGELGVSATTMRQIGARADVAPGTLRAHFPTRDELERAMVRRLTDEAPLPELTLFDDNQTLEERISRLTHATGSFLDGAARLYRMWLREPMLSDPWSEAGARYGTRWDELMRRALGALADDRDAMTLLRAILQPTFYEALRAGTRSTDEVSEFVAALFTRWLVGRRTNRKER